MFEEDLDSMLSSERPELDPFVDPEYTEIKAGAKFTPIKRGLDYSVYVIEDAHPINGKVKVSEILYAWCDGYYSRLNRKPIELELDREILCSTHSPACQGKKKKSDWRSD